MITLLAILVSLWLTGLFMLMIGRFVAPEGYEDAKGFHFGAPGREVVPVAAQETLPPGAAQATAASA